MMQLWSQRWRLLLLPPNFQRFKHTCVTHESKCRLREAFFNGDYFASTFMNQRCRLHGAFFNGGYFASTLLLPSINMDGNHEVKCTSKHSSLILSIYISLPTIFKLVHLALNLYRLYRFLHFQAL